MKQLLHTECGFDPTTKVTQALTEEQLPAYIPLVDKKSGTVIIDPETSQIAYAPKMILRIDDYIEWFWKAYPEGRFESERLTEGEAKVLDDGTIFYPPEVFKVAIYKKADDPKPSAIGFGSEKVGKEAKYGPMATAHSKALKDGLRMLGFGVDIDWGELEGTLPAYKELPSMRESGYIPTGKTCNSEKGSTAPNDHKPDCSSEKKEKKSCSESTIENNNPSDPVFPENLEDYYTQQALQDAPVEKVAGNSIDSNELESAKNIAFRVLDGVDGPLAALSGKKVGQLMEEDKGAFSLLLKPTFPAETVVPKEVLEAIKFLAKENKSIKR